MATRSGWGTIGASILACPTRLFQSRTNGPAKWCGAYKKEKLPHFSSGQFSFLGAHQLSPHCTPLRIPWRKAADAHLAALRKHREARA